MLVVADIPFSKVNNPYFKDFIEKYTNKKTLMPCNIVICYDKTLCKMRQTIAENKIWVSVDKSQDNAGRSVANIIGILSLKVWEKSFY